jgi:antitoxin component of RelBE/YafQ-DinJ toxin-antitoxin module
MQKKVNMTIDYDVWKNAKAIIKSESGMSLSKYVEITLRALPRAQEGTVKEYMQETIMDFFRADKTLSVVEKEKAERVIMGKKAKSLKKKK